MYIFLGALVGIIVVTYFMNKISRKSNILDGAFISDVLIGYTLNLMGKSKKDVEDYFTNVKLTYNKKEKEDFFYGHLSNRCDLVITLTNEKVSKILIKLIAPPLGKDLSNLKLFAKMHEKEYEFFSINYEQLGPMIAFQAK